MAQAPFQIPYKFKCRPYQYDAWKAIERGCKRLVCCWHRGCGKDLLFLNALIAQMVEHPAVYLHCFPKYSQGKRAVWNSVHETHAGEMMQYLDHIPQKMIKHKNSSEMTIQLHNGSIYCVMGMDGKNATQARGMNPKFVILSEYAYMDPEAWYTLEPRISQNNGTAVFLSTPNGQNHFYKLYNYAKTQPKEYFTSLLSVDDTLALDSHHIENLRNEGVPEDFIQQEYFCSFTRGAEGSYYGKQIQKARDDDRITSLPIVSDLPCSTAWDIGIGDSTSIWIYQHLNNGKINLIQYYENQGEGIEHYIKWLDRWKIDNSVLWERHFVPHDMANKQFATGNELVQTARQMGMEMTVVPKKSIEEGIQCVRSTLSLCSFDEKRCKKGIECLDFYRKKWNDILKVYNDEPLHDKYSHGADAFRYLCMGLKVFGAAGKLSPERILEMRQRNLGY
jgi:phage terminase large subunit